MRISPKLSAWLLGAAIGAVLLPTTAFAQATIAGVVRDTSGAVLPGVTVEASSPVLIEKVRTAVTDGSGQFRIVDLRAGTYVVTFTLPGFSDGQARGHRADRIVHRGRQRRAARRRARGNDHGDGRDADRRRAERAPADHRDARRSRSIPTARGFAGVMLLMPAIQTQGRGGQRADHPGMIVFGGAGGRNGNEGRLQVDGLASARPSTAAACPPTTPTSPTRRRSCSRCRRGLGEAEVSGPTLSIVPKTGGNSVRGAVYLAGVGQTWWTATTRRSSRRRGSACPDGC